MIFFRCKVKHNNRLRLNACEEKDIRKTLVNEHFHCWYSHSNVQIIYECNINQGRYDLYIIGLAVISCSLFNRLI